MEGSTPVRRKRCADHGEVPDDIEILPVHPADLPAWCAVEPGVAWPSRGGVPPEARLPEADWTWLGAWRGARCVGRLRARQVQSDLEIVSEVTTAEGEDVEQLAPRLLAELGRRLPSPRIWLYAEELEEDVPLIRWIDAAGFVVSRRKVVVRRELPFTPPVDMDGLSLQSLAERGEEAFARVMERAAEGDPLPREGPRDAVAALRDLVADAGEAFHAERWWVVREADEDVGVLLPQTFAEGGAEGTIFYVAVLPRHRRRGLGRRLHAVGLHALGELGATHYIGSTDVRNIAMLRVFEQNGCREIARQRYYDRPCS